MTWIKRTRLTVIVGLLLAGATVAWLAAHPQLYAGQLGRLVTRNLLQGIDASISFEDMSGNPLRGLTFHRVVFVRNGASRDFQYVIADSVRVRYDARALLRREPQLNELAIWGAQVVLREGVPDTSTVDRPHPLTTIENLPRLQVDDLRLEGADVTVTAADGSELHRIIGVRTRLSLRGDGRRLESRIESLRGRWPTQDIRVHAARGQAVFAPPELRFSEFHAHLDSSRADFDLTLGFEPDGTPRLDVAGTAYDFLLDEVLRLIVKENDDTPRLRLSGEGRVRMRDDRMRIEGSGDGWLDDAPVLAREFVGVLDETKLVFERVDGSYRSADGRARGVLYTQEDPIRLELSGDVRGVDLADRWTGEDLGWPTTDLAGQAEVGLFFFTDDTAAIDIDATGLSGRVEDLPIDDARVRLRYDDGEGLVVDEARVLSQAAELSARGTIDAADRVDLFVEARSGPVGAWAERVELPLTGTGLAVGGRLIGPLENLTLEVAGTIDSLAWGQLGVTTSRVWLRIPDLDASETLSAGLESDRLAVGTREVGRVKGEIRRDGLVTEIPNLRVSVPDSSVSVSGRVREDPETGVFSIEADTLVADLGGDLWRLAEPATVDVATTGFRTEGIDVRSRTGRFVLLGFADEVDGFGLQLQVLDGDLSILDRVGLVDAIAGDVRCALQLAGTADRPELDATVDVEGLRLGPRRVDTVGLSGKVRGADVEISDLRVSSAHGQARASGAMTLPFADWIARLREDPGLVTALWSEATLDLEVRTEDLDLESWIEPASAGGAFGRLGATLTLSGPTRTPVVEGRVEVSGLPAEPFVLPWIEGEIRADADGLHVREGRLDLGGPDASFEGTLPLFVSFVDSTRVRTDRGLAFDLDTGEGLDLSTLDALWPQVRAIGGRGRLQLGARGSLASPRLTGSLEVREGSFALDGWAEELRAVEVDGAFEGRELWLRRVFAREGLRGEIDGRGRVAFDGLLPDDIDLDLRARRILIASVPYLRAIGSSDDLRLRIERPAPDSPRAPRITGTVTVDKAIYTGEFVAEGEPDPALLPTRAPLWLADLRIRMQDQVRISNQSAELRVAGDVSLVRDLSGLRLRGVVEIPQGRVPLFNNDFTITEGTLDFSRRPVEPEVDIRAETEVPIYDPSGNFGRELERITVHLTGTFAQPSVQFESESGLDETAILRLLAGLGPESTDVAAAGLTDVGLRAGLNFVERALANRIRGIDTIDIQTEEVGLGDMQSTRIAVGKYLSPSLYLRFSQGLSVTERDLYLEYQLTRRTLFTSELRRRLRESGAENEFNLDLKFRVKY